MKNFRRVLAEIEARMSEGGDWCSIEKASTLAAILVGLRPKIVVELGVWKGGSAIPMAITLREIGSGRLVAVDAWSAEVSVSGQENDHLKWWGETMGADGHEHAFRTFMARLEKHNAADRCQVIRKRTDAAEVPSSIDVLHHDANHGPQAVLDVERWAPAVRVGGYFIVDDLDWPGDQAPDAVRHVRRARDRALDMGFIDLYPLGTGCVMQRVVR
jgi:predicted O-methyltransferase YrrM